MQEYYSVTKRAERYQLLLKIFIKFKNSPSDDTACSREAEAEDAVHSPLENPNDEDGPVPLFLWHWLAEQIESMVARWQASYPWISLGSLLVANWSHDFLTLYMAVVYVDGIWKRLPFRSRSNWRFWVMKTPNISIL